MSQFSKTFMALTLALMFVACNENTAPGNDRSADKAPPPPQSPVASVEKAIKEAPVQLRLTVKWLSLNLLELLLPKE